MFNEDSMQKIEPRVAELERQVRVWKRAAIAVAGVCALAFVGWAPQLDTGKPDIDSLDPKLDAPDNQENLSEGDKSYAVSRLEWMSVRSNSMVMRDTWNSHGFIIQFVSGGAKSDTIRIVATYDKTRVNRDRMNAEMDAATRALEVWAKHRQWDKWLNIGKDFVPR